MAWEDFWWETSQSLKEKGLENKQVMKNREIEKLI